MQIAATRKGRIELICGCMFSGKSERLLARLAEARTQGKSVAAFKHASDDRYARDQIVAHSGERGPAVGVNSAEEVLPLARGAQLVAIDEAQFFDPALPAVCRTLAARGIDVVIAGLDRDSWGEPFGPVRAVAAIADVVTRTTATCAVCGAAAEYTQRTLPVNQVTMIGGAEAYQPRCHTCFSPPPIELRR